MLHSDPGSEMRVLKPSSISVCSTDCHVLFSPDHSSVSKVSSIALSSFFSPPLIVSLNLQEESLLKANRKYFQDFGFEIEPFGGKEYCINAVPANLYGLEEEELFLEMLDNLASEKDKDPLGIFASRLATMACKAAVKGKIPYFTNMAASKATVQALRTIKKNGNIAVKSLQEFHSEIQ